MRELHSGRLLNSVSPENVDASLCEKSDEKFSMKFSKVIRLKFESNGRIADVGIFVFGRMYDKATASDNGIVSDINSLIN